MRVDEQIVSRLALHGVRAAFGVPGSQNVGLYDAVGSSALTLITTTSELTAGFAAVGYGRVSRIPALLLTIPGPGLTYAIPALAEAMHDAVPLILVLQESKNPDGPDHQLQALDEAAILEKVTKRVVRVEATPDVPSSVDSAFVLACADRPGPVAILLARGLGDLAATPGRPPASIKERYDGRATQDLENLAIRLKKARRAIFLVGHAVDAVAENLNAVAGYAAAFVMATPAARGVIDEMNPRCLVTDRRDIVPINRLLGEADLIVSFGVKFSHSNTFGFAMNLPKDSHVCIGTDGPEETSSFAGSRIKLPVRDAVILLERLLAGNASKALDPSWDTDISIASKPEPEIIDASPATVSEFFRQLRQYLPSEAILVTDSGNHQFLARRHYCVQRPAGLLTPAEFQSMGFALPASIGVRLAEPGGQVAVIIGDGSLQMTGMELLTMVRMGFNIPVFVFCDGRYGLIHTQQIQRFGRSSGTDIAALDLEGFAEGIGAAFARYEGDIKAVLDVARLRNAPTIIEVRLRDNKKMKMQARKVKIKRSVQRLLRS